jgi:transmembrane sensor
MSDLETRAEEIRGEALAWLARLQRADLSEADGEAFEAWLVNPAHRDAYAVALSVWHEYEAAAPAVLVELDAMRAPTHVIAFGRKAAPSRRWLIGAGGFAAAASLAVVLIPPMLAASQVQTFATGKGERREIALADGSTVHLNAETTLKVRYTGDRRAIEMAEGEAIFDVRRDAARPFTVATPSREVRVLGTQFDVRSRSGDLTVTVAHGRVQVSPHEGADGGAYLLTRGQRLRVASSGAEAVRFVDPGEAFAWRAGRLIYREQPLSEVVADLNRQFTTQIEIGDAELAAMPITGVIVLDDANAVLARLSLMLPIRSVPSPSGHRLLRK